MTVESCYKVASVGVPYFASPIIAGGGKILSIFTESAVGKRLLMRLQL